MQFKFKLYEKIIECWKSNYNIESLNYRFDSAQLLHLPMAVLIQEMIEDGFSGMLLSTGVLLQVCYLLVIRQKMIFQN